MKGLIHKLEIALVLRANRVAQLALYCPKGIWQMLGLYRLSNNHQEANLRVRVITHTGITAERYEALFV